MEQITIAIPTYERVEMTLNSFSKVYNDERISEIVIVDDASKLETFNELKSYCDMLPKVRLYRNITNQDCYRNKMTAISYAKSSYVIILDSDNEIDAAYLDKIYEQEWDENTILMPDFASPNFSYQDYSGLTLTKENIAEYIDKPMLETCLNCMNYFVNKNKYLEVWDGSVDPVTSDSLYQNYNWIMSGKNFKIVEGLRYNHAVHPFSHYINNVHRTGDFREKILEKIRKLKTEVVS